jgi:hypothetical protein
MLRNFGRQAASEKISSNWKDSQLLVSRYSRKVSAPGGERVRFHYTPYTANVRPASLFGTLRIGYAAIGHPYFRVRTAYAHNASIV